MTSTTTTIPATAIVAGDTVTYCGETFHAHRVTHEDHGLIKVDTLDGIPQYIATTRTVQVTRTSPVDGGPLPVPGRVSAPAPAPAPRRVVMQFIRPRGTVRHAYVLGEGRTCPCGAVDDIDAHVISNTFAATAAYRPCRARRAAGL